MVESPAQDEMRHARQGNASRSSSPASLGLMLRPSSAARLLTLHPLPPPSALRAFNALSALRRRTPPTTYRTRRSVATLVTETSGAQHSILTHAPALKDIEDSEYDADLLPPEEATLEITQRAAEVRLRPSSIPDPLFATPRSASVPLLDTRVDGRSSSVFIAITRDLAAREKPQGSSEDNHRVWGMPWVPVQNGTLETFPARRLVSYPTLGHIHPNLTTCPLRSVLSHPVIKPSNIVVDAISMSLLKGSTIDFVTEMIGSTFRVVENPQSKGSGCGCGVSWELKL